MGGVEQMLLTHKDDIAAHKSFSERFGTSRIMHRDDGAVLGDEKLNYLGYSYGTFLGATYADLYPGKTGRLVFDGALDPSTTSFDVTRTQAVGFENAFVMRAGLARPSTTRRHRQSWKIHP